MPLHNQHENPVKSEIRSFLRQRKVTSDETDDKSALQMTNKWWLTIVIKEECVLGETNKLGPVYIIVAFVFDRQKCLHVH